MSRSRAPGRACRYRFGAVVLLGMLALPALAAPPRQHAGGGYETRPARSSCLGVGAEPRIRAGVLRLRGEIVPAAAARAGEGGDVLWYRTPAASWTEALPIGNGRLGAMVHGGVDVEHLQLNEDTLYSGGPDPVGVVPIHRHVDDVFAHIRRGEYAEATRIIDEQMLGRNHQSYTTLGDLRLRMAHHGPYGPYGETSDYHRRLEPDRAVARVAYRRGGARFDREIFASAADGVIVLRLSCDRPGLLTFSASLETPHAFARLGARGTDTIALTAKAPMHTCNRSITQIRRLGDTQKYPQLFGAEGRLKADVPENARVVYPRDESGGGSSSEAPREAPWRSRVSAPSGARPRPEGART